jgi:hypothetical protein
MDAWVNGLNDMQEEENARRAAAAPFGRAAPRQSAMTLATAFLAS